VDHKQVKLRSLLSAVVVRVPDEMSSILYRKLTVCVEYGYIQDVWGSIPNIVKIDHFNLQKYMSENIQQNVGITLAKKTVVGKETFTWTT
jgi:hypothetical protein